MTKLILDFDELKTLKQSFDFYRRLVSHIEDTRITHELNILQLEKFLMNDRTGRDFSFPKRLVREYGVELFFHGERYESDKILKSLANHKYGFNPGFFPEPLVNIRNTFYPLDEIQGFTFSFSSLSKDEEISRWESKDYKTRTKSREMYVINSKGYYVARYLFDKIIDVPYNSIDEFVNNF